jgi:YVTN family beta-propeller protein
VRSHARIVAVAAALAACGGYPTVAAIDAGGIALGTDAAGPVDAGAGHDASATDAGGDASPLDAGGRDAGAGDGGGRDASDPNIDDGPPPPFTAGTSTLAGRALPGYVDGTREQTRFADPVNVAYRDGQVYVADFDNNRIRVIDAATHETTTLIEQSGFERPFGLAFAPDGTLFVSTDNDPDGGHSLSSGSIWRVAAGGRSATLVARAIGRPRGLVVLPDGRLATADYIHHVIELIAPATGGVTLLAGAWDQPGFADGDAASGRFSAPYGLAVRSDGTLVVADYDNHRIRLVTLDGTSSTLAGGAPGFHDGALAGALFRNPQGIAIAGNGDLFVSELGNNRIRRIAGGSVATIAGNGIAGYLDHDDPLASQLYGLEGLAVVPDGSMLYVADGGRGEQLPFNRIRQVARHW